MTEELIAMSGADINDSDVQMLVGVLRSGVLSLGPRIEEFELLVSERVNVRHGLAVSSGTAGLHMIVRALGLGPNDEVLVPSFTFAASVNSFLFEGAAPVFVDIEPDTYNLDPMDIESRISKKTRAIMVVDVFGHPAEWDSLLEIADRHELFVIDDSCEALGAEYRGRPIGSFGNAAAFAFYPNKQITTGEGGMVVTDDDEVAKVIRSMRNQGRDEMGSWLQHERLGFNYRMDEMSAALGVSQISRLDEFLSKRETVANRYTNMLMGFDWVRPPIVRPHVRPSWFVYVVTLAAGIDRNTVMKRMAEEGIPTRAYFSPIHRQPYILDLLGPKDWDLPVTEDIAGRTLALPFHNNLTSEEAERVVGSLARAAASAG